MNLAEGEEESDKDMIGTFQGGNWRFEKDSSNKLGK